ncbi:MAG: IS3 family transposase [Thiobacillus sp.]|nr:IS3 family transposase [Thiobacillus sp.]
MIKQFRLESGSVYGYRKISDDLREVGETCGKHRVHRLVKSKGLRSQTGYCRRPGLRHGRPLVVALNHLQQQFGVTEPMSGWPTSPIPELTRRLYLVVVLDLFSRQVVGAVMHGSGAGDQRAVDGGLAASACRTRHHPDQGSQLAATTGRPS